jgi:hypothetical protein
MDIDEALHAVERARDEALEVLASAGSNMERIEGASRLVTILQERVKEAAQIRQDEVIRLWLAEGLSLGELGRRLGLSKARADQIVRAYKARNPDYGTRRSAPPVPVLGETEIGDEIPSTVLYRLFGAAGDLLYAGVTGDLRGRFTQHAADKHWWSQVTRKTVTWYGSRSDALLAETAAIADEHPRYNIVGVFSERLAG